MKRYFFSAKMALLCAVIAALLTCTAGWGYVETIYDLVQKKSIEYDSLEDTSFFYEDMAFSNTNEAFLLYLGSKGKSSYNELNFWPIFLMKTTRMNTFPVRITINVDGNVFRINDISPDDVELDDNSTVIHSVTLAMENMDAFEAIASAKRVVKVRIQDAQSNRADFDLTPSQVIDIGNILRLYGRSGEYSEPADEEYDYTLMTGRCSGTIKATKKVGIYRVPEDYEPFTDNSANHEGDLEVGAVAKVSMWRDVPTPGSDWFSRWYLLVKEDGEHIGWVDGDMIDISAVVDDKASEEPYDIEWEDDGIDTAAVSQVADAFQYVLIDFYSRLLPGGGFTEAKSFDINIGLWDEDGTMRKVLRSFQSVDRVYQVVERYRYGADEPYDVGLYAYKSRAKGWGSGSFPTGVDISMKDVEAYFGGRHRHIFDSDFSVTAYAVEAGYFEGSGRGSRPFSSVYVTHDDDDPSRAKEVALSTWSVDHEGLIPVDEVRALFEYTPKPPTPERPEPLPGAVPTVPSSQYDPGSSRGSSTRFYAFVGSLLTLAIALITKSAKKKKKNEPAPTALPTEEPDGSAPTEPDTSEPGQTEIETSVPESPASEPTGSEVSESEQTDASPERPAAKNFCPHCGGKLTDPNGTFCPHCGGKV